MGHALLKSFWRGLQQAGRALYKPRWYLPPGRLASYTSSATNQTADACDADQTEDKGPWYPDPPSREHHDMASYLAYARRTGLKTSSTTYVGTMYEYTVAATLRKFGFDLRRIGGRGDYGVDLLGTWTVPSVPKPLRVILQCKVTSPGTALGPHQIRELEGAFAGAPPGWRGSAVIGLLVAQKKATKGVHGSVGRSLLPMGFIFCTSAGEVEQFLWNSRAEDAGLGGLGVSVRHSEEGPNKKSLVLTWKGRPVPVANSEAV